MDRADQHLTRAGRAKDGLARIEDRAAAGREVLPVTEGNVGVVEASVVECEDREHREKDRGREQDAQQPRRKPRSGLVPHPAELLSIDLGSIN